MRNYHFIHKSKNHIIFSFGNGLSMFKFQETFMFDASFFID